MNFDSESDLSDAESTGEQQFSPKLSCLLIAIDTGQSMFSVLNDNKSSFMHCIEFCHQLAESLLLTSRGSIKGPLAVFLADNDENKAKLIDFDNGMLETVNSLKILGELSEQELSTKFARKGDLHLGDFFLFCQQTFAQIKGNVFKKIVVYITNDDNPINKGDVTKQKFNIITVSENFAKVQNYLRIMTFKSDFDKNHIYDEVLSAAHQTDVIQVANATDLLREVEPFIQEKYTKYRIPFYPFKDNTDVAIQLVIHKLIKMAQIRYNMHVSKDNQKEVIKFTGQQDEEENLEEEKTYTGVFNKGMSTLSFTASEKMKFGELDLPVGLHLVCIANTTFKEGWIIEGATFIDKHVEETDPMFDIIWEFCINKSKCLICLRKYKIRGKVRYVELIPRCIDDKRMFLTRAFPFGNEIYYDFQPKPCENTFTPQDEEAMTELVNAMTIDYDPHNFEHPVDGKRRAYVKSQLLDEPMKDIHTGVPSDEQVDQLISKWVNKLTPVHETSKSNKRTAASPSKASKRGKTTKK